MQSGYNQTLGHPFCLFYENEIQYIYIIYIAYIYSQFTWSADIYVHPPAKNLYGSWGPDPPLSNQFFFQADHENWLSFDAWRSTNKPKY